MSIFSIMKLFTQLPLLSQFISAPHNFLLFDIPATMDKLHIFVKRITHLKDAIYSL